MDELADLAFLVDEVILEPEGPRGRACATQLYLRVHRGDGLDGYVERLLRGAYADPITRRDVGRALACWAYRTDDGALVQRLLEGPLRLPALQLDHREAVGPRVVSALATHAERSEGVERSRAFVALYRLGTHGADLGPAIPVALASLGTPAAGRGHARVDLDADAKALLVIAARGEGLRARILAELERLETGRGKSAVSARALRTKLTA